MGIYVTIICDIVKLTAMVFGFDIGTHDALLEATKLVCSRGKSPFARFRRLAAGAACISRLQTKLWRQEISDLGG